MVTSDVELQDQVADAITPEQIIDTLDQAAMHAVADRLAYLRNLAAHDPEEPTLQLDSLRALADCLMRHRELPIRASRPRRMGCSWSIGASRLTPTWRSGSRQQR